MLTESICLKSPRFKMLFNKFKYVNVYGIIMCLSKVNKMEK